MNKEQKNKRGIIPILDLHMFFTEQEPFISVVYFIWNAFIQWPSVFLFYFLHLYSFEKHNTVYSRIGDAQTTICRNAQRIWPI